MAARPGISLAEPGDFVSLLKPRVMSLVMLTAVTGFVLAPGSIHPFLGLVSILAIAVGAGASGALNMWYDADIDRLMARTAKRPVPRGRIQPEGALAFGLSLSVLSVLTLGLVANWFAAAFLAFTIFFYAVVYTMWLKRSTPQNIVIGGAAGAFPPLIGWAAATGEIALLPVLLFLFVFLWTPPHSWALALYSAGDYAKAGIPMMPVARGARSTRLQILIYSLIFVPTAVAPALVGVGGLIYLVVSVAGGLGFLGLAWRLFRSRAGDEPDKAEAVGREAALYDVKVQAKPARDLFAFSILYLMALFSALLVEALAGLGA